MDASPTQAFDACLKEAMVHTQDWVPRWLDKLRDGLSQREAATVNLQEKQALAETRVALENYRDRIASRFIEQLADAVYGSLQSGEASTRRLQGLSFDELELMGDEQVQETVELARVQQVVKMAADEELVALNTLICSAQGLSRVRPESNPLRTDVVVGALMRAVSGLHAGPAVRSRWLQIGALPLGKELQHLYAHLANFLERLGVRPVGYHLIQAPESRGPSTMPPQEEAVMDGSMLGGSALLTIDHLHQLLIGNLDPVGSPTTDQGGPAAGNAMVRTLAAEVVTFMLKRVSEDQRLLPAVRQGLLDMKPALLQLARSDPRFFADRQNPARRLLDAVTARALAFTSEQDPDYEAFARQVHGMQRELQKPGTDLASRFARLLETLNQTPALTPDKAQARGQAVKTLVRVEQRNLLAERVANEFRARNDFDRVPGVVRRFLTGPWAQVVAQARMDMPDDLSIGTNASQDSAAHRYTDMLPDLLWSCQLSQASRNRPRLVKIIPGLLRTLREGLDAIDYPREKSEAFFQTLMGLHEAAYKTQRTEVLEDAPISQQVEEDLEPWLQPNEARETGFLEEAFLETTTQPNFLDTQPMQHDWADLKADIDVQEQVIAVGTWVDVWNEGQPVRAQLTWASPHHTMFLFTSAGGRSISMTRRGLDHLLGNNRMRIVAHHGVIDEALDEVARRAWINSS
nr:DUF1631 domain-containing protein [Hydrogenophaga sp.]